MPHISWWLYAIPIISATIYWLVIRIARKRIFHPIHPIKVLGFTLQGFLPRRHRQIAETLGPVITHELLSPGEFGQTITHPDNVRRILPLAEEHIDHFLRVKLKESMPMISMFIGEKTIGQLKTVFISELEELFPLIMRNYVSHLSQDPNLERLVVEKIAGLSAGRLETVLNKLLAKEFRSLEIAASALGFLIGLLQIALTFWIKK